jgi:hypothetical protein
MKSTFLFIAFLFLYSGTLFAQVSINSTGSQPDPSAGLDVSFTDKGFLPPRVSLTATNSASPVTAPAAGLLIYNTAVAGASPNNVTPGYYYWDGAKWTPVSSPQGTNPGDMQYWNGSQWVIVPAGSTGEVLIFSNGIPTWGGQGVPSSTCGFSFTINHIAGAVAPVNKTVTYPTVTNIPGATTKCWITRNLGASRQATTVDDTTEASAGWYWQFNRKQGFKHDGSIRTPNTLWINPINEGSDWISGNDPCTLELGAGWRIPTITEWTNVDAGGNWTTENGPWGSSLKMHKAGRLITPDGTLFIRGIIGLYWSSKQSGTTFGSILQFMPGDCSISTGDKAYGQPIRCIRDY